MFTNYFKVAARNLLRNKSYTIINLLGLSVGMASCFLLFLLIKFELSFDKFHTKKDRICRVVTVFEKPDGTRYSSGVPFPVAEGLRIDYPQLEKVADVYETEDVQLTVPGPDAMHPDKKFKESTGVCYAEAQVFNILDFTWLAGAASTALSAPGNAVITRETAQRYFGDWKSAVGKTIVYRNRDTYTVSGVIEDFPVNSDFPFKAILSFASFKNRSSGMFKDWVSVFGSNHCYVLLPPAMDTKQFDRLLTAFTKAHRPPEYLTDRLVSQSLADMHFDLRFHTFSPRIFDKGLISALTLVGIFLLLIACVNFINLATAQAVNRSREVGVRKVLGGDRSQLMMQFLIETAAIAGLALAVGLTLAEIALPFLNQLLELSLSLNILSDPWALLFLVVLFLSVTVLSGFYPAMVLSGFTPISVLKNKASLKLQGGISLRRALVVLQFVIAQVLIIGMLVVMDQMDFFRHASLGFDKDAVMTVPVPNDSLSIRSADLLKNRLLQQSGITAVSFSAFGPSDDSHWDSDFMFDRSTANTEFNADLKWADADFFRTYDIEFVAGRPYLQSDTVREFVVNETLTRKLGLRNPQDILGKQIRFWNGELSAPVVGVVKDFHAASLRKPMDAVVLGCWKNTYQLVNIKIKPVQVEATLASVEKLWNETYPRYIYEYQFLDEKIEQFYRNESRLSQLYKIFAGIAMFVSCLGLYGLVSFMAFQRTKEVGIRKVLGASVGSIILLLSREFSILIGVAFTIAAPIAYFVMNGWLEDFAFRVHLGVGLFLIAICGTVTLAWLTVGYRAIKTANANPVEALRYSSEEPKSRSSGSKPYAMSEVAKIH